MRRIEGRTVFKIKSLNQEKILNEISKNFSLYNVNREEYNISSFEVQSKYYKIVKQMLKGQSIEILQIKHKGFLFLIKKLFVNYGLIVGIICSIIFYLIQMNFILKIDVMGTSELSQAEVCDFVRKSINTNLKNKIDTKDIEIKLKNNFDKISSVSVAIVGQSLIVSINEKILPDEMEGNYKPIISQYDGKITDITLIQGTMAVEVGDIVRKGDILVFPYIIDADGKQREVEPSAEIIADVWLKGESKHYDSYTETVETGNQVEYCEITLFGNVIYSNCKEVPFENFILEESEKYFSKNNILPFIIKRKIYKEVEYVTINKSFDEVENEKIEEAKQNVLISLDESEIIKSENCSIKSAAGITIVSYVITVSRSIGG